jgi:nitrate/TMAO reductase-like tetraheme cytochrome c subunit
MGGSIFKEFVRNVEEGLSVKAKLLILVLAILFIAVSGFVGYSVFDYTQNNPRFCVSCHLMADAYTAWELSVHKGVNCHDCHHLSVAEMNELMYNFVVHRPEEVPDRHGKIIVPWKYCVSCHWEENEEYEDAPMINGSKIHAKHYFTEQIECSKCHGYKAHMFVPEERFCLQCHEGVEVHGSGMEELACINCHSDAQADLRPERAKCLFCHGTDEDRSTLLTKEGRTDVHHFTPDKKVVRSATKIDVPADAPMQFDCYKCHHPHNQVRPDIATCKSCHSKQEQIGKHSLHVEGMAMQCVQCHKPHIWTVTEKEARESCSGCHEYKPPADFIR